MVVVETNRLLLREWVPDDWVRFKPLATDPRVIKYIGDGQPWSDERIANRVGDFVQLGRSRGWILWAVIHRADSRLIGFCGFSDGFPPDVEIGWRLLPEYWGQGLATEAAAAALEYGFATWDFPRVIAVAHIPNVASIRVMEKIGMRPDGTFLHEGIELVRYVIGNPRLTARGSENTLPLTCRRATLEDVPLLARMNQQLIEDESSRNPMSPGELESRMAGWIGHEWQAVVIEQQEQPVGYTLFQFRHDEYVPSEVSISLRQFFIGREVRGRGVGRQAFEIIAESYFSDASQIVLDVLEANPRGRRFWETLGFRADCTTMTRHREIG